MAGWQEARFQEAGRQGGREAGGREAGMGAKSSKATPRPPCTASPAWPEGEEVQQRSLQPRPAPVGKLHDSLQGPKKWVIPHYTTPFFF